jgi:hypothetical protein
MSLYRLFLFRQGEFICRVSRHCGDDLEAVGAARQICEEYTIEVYHDKRLVARVKRHDKSLNAPVS